MSRVFIDGFESGGTDLWSSQDHAEGVSVQEGMSGDHCLDVTYLSAYVERTISAKNELYVAMKYRPSGDLTSTRTVVTFRNAGSTLLILKMANTTGCLVASRYITTLATSSNALSPAVTYLIEVYVKIDSTNGRFVVNVNGVNWIDYTGNTQPGTATTVDAVRLGANGLSGYYAKAYYDDIVIDDATGEGHWIGDTKIQEGVLPTAVGNSAQWTPSAGANWECVHEVPASDLDYIETNVADKLDLYAMTNLSGNIESIKCIQIQARVRKEGSPTPQNLKLALRTGSTDYVSADKAVPTTYAALFNLWEVNPDTSAAWAGSEIDALEAGVKSAA